MNRIALIGVLVVAAVGAALAAGWNLSAGRPAATVDGTDISPALLGTGPSPRDAMFFYRGVQLYAVRKGPFKAHFITRPAYGAGKPEEHDPPLLYHLGHDPSEKYDVAKGHPDVLAELRQEIERHRAALKPGPCQLTARIPKEPGQ